MPRSTILIATQVLTVLVLVVASLGLAGLDQPWAKLWPSAAALLLVLVTRRVIIGLLTGALCGSILITEGNLLAAVAEIFTVHLFPNFSSTWKLSALLFTLLLGSFAAMIEAGGGLRTLVSRWLQRGVNPQQTLQFSTFGLGFICFFDGLANSMLLGRVTRSMADRTGVARVKMAYLVDSTSSAIACVAFISTWIGTQLSLIGDGLEAAGAADRFNPYSLFFASIPLNFYCLFTLFLVFLVIWRQWNVGPMRRFEQRASGQTTNPTTGAELGAGAPVVSALLPLAVLVGSILGLCAWVGLRESDATTLANRLAEGFSSSWVPYILVLGSLLGIAAAAALFPRARDDRSVGPLRAFAGGAAGLMVPVLILIAAWVLGSVIGELVTDEAIRELTGPLLRGEFLGALVFVVSAIVAFSIGSSWGTMGLMMPLALAFAFALDPSAGSAVMGSQLSLAIAAVFSGAVFGDHCSPFSDTTIVSSISTGVEPIDHVKTQLPYALVAAGVALLLGFLPAGLGWLPLVIAWLPGALALLVLVLWTGWRGAGR